MSEPTGRELLVLRHAKSAWPEGVDDRDRPLRPKGERAAGRVGRFLAANDLVPTAALASPARRAVDTARLVLDGAGVGDDGLAVALDERIYGGDTRVAVDEALMGLGAAGGRLLVVGHEPELVELVGSLTGAAVALPTAGLARITLDEADFGAQRGRLLLLSAAKLLADG